MNEWEAMVYYCPTNPPPNHEAIKMKLSTPWEKDFEQKKQLSWQWFYIGVTLSSKSYVLNIYYISKVR